MTPIQMLYSGLTLPLSFALFPFFLLSRRGRSRVWERYGVWRLRASAAGQRLIWFHAASAGEMNGLIPVMAGIRQRYPACRILATATSVTGLDRAAASADYVRLLPFDNPLWVRRGIAGLNIEMFVMTETEIWPVLLQCLQQRNIPVCLINGIISDYTFKYYRALRPLVSRLLARVDLILCSDENSRQRFIELGAADTGVRVAGNSKYDVKPSVTSREQAALLKQRFFGNSAAVLVLGSLRPGEEKFWFDALRGNSDFNVIVAPRHQEKYEYFSQKLGESNLPFTRWSARSLLSSGAQAAGIVLLDTMGELEAACSFADVVFVGGTLQDFGGHNPLEAAAYGACIVLGPHISRIREIAEALAGGDAVLRVENSDDARLVLERLKKSPQELKHCGQRAQAVYQRMTGATERIVAGIAEVFQQRQSR